jgi:hypothetical protein
VESDAIVEPDLERILRVEDADLEGEIVVRTEEAEPLTEDAEDC